MKDETEIQVRLQEIAVEKEKHAGAIRSCIEQKKVLQLDLDSTKKDRTKRVNELLEKEFIETSEKGLLNKVLTTTIKEPKLHQLTDSIEKLATQEEWHRKKNAELSTESAQLKNDLDDLHANDLCREIYEEWSKLKSSYGRAEGCFERMKHKVLQVRSLDDRYDTRFSKLGIKDETMINVVTSKFRAEIAGQMTLLKMIFDLSTLYQLADNIWHDDVVYLQRSIGQRISHHREDFSNDVLSQ